MGGDGEADEGLRMLRDAMQRALSESTGDDSALWTMLVQDLGLCGLGIDERLGGLGGDAGHAWAVMEAQGGSIRTTPFLSTMVLGAGVLKHAGGEAADGLLKRIAAGGLRVAVAYREPGARNALSPQGTVIDADGRLSGRKVGVLDAEAADIFIISARDAAGGIWLGALPADAAGVRITVGDAIDGGRWGDLALDGVAVLAGWRIGDTDQGLAPLEWAIDEATVAVCAEAVGAMNAMLERTVDYVKQRRQFGRAIGEFQVVQHRLVDMLIAVEQAASLAKVAGDKLDGPVIDRMEAVSGAKVLIGNACRVVAQGAVQLHGGIGTTQELDLSVFFRRALMAESLFGDASFHLKRYESLSRQKMKRGTISGPMGQSEQGVTL